jgi:hypothetical protein
VDAIAKSYAKFGQRKPIVVRKMGDGPNGPTGQVIAGNHQLQAAKQLGWSHIAAIFVEDDEATARAYAIADNRTAELAEWDKLTLSSTLEELAGEGWDLADLGFPTIAPATDPAAEWTGMPDYEQDDKLSAFHCTIHFATEQDAVKFFELIGQEKRSSTWWPVSDGLVGSDVKQQYVAAGEDTEEDADAEAGE